MTNNNQFSPLLNTLPSFILKAPLLYLNVLERQQISSDLQNKCGVYCWYNLINGNYYIGSGVILTNRINDYFQPSYYRDKSNLIIVINNEIWYR